MSEHGQTVRRGGMIPNERERRKGGEGKGMN